MTTSPPPPSVPDALVPARESTWPTVIGILAIIFAVLAMVQHGLCAPFGLVASRLGQSLLESAGQSGSAGPVEVQQAQLEVINRYLLPMIISMVASFGVAVVLLTGGIALVRRRLNARRRILTWAVLKMLVAIGASALNYEMGQAQFEAMAAAAAADPSASGQMPAGFFSLIQNLGAFGSVLGLLWLWLLPIFMLVWLNLHRIRDEVSRWS